MKSVKKEEKHKTLHKKFHKSVEIVHSLLALQNV